VPGLAERHFQFRGGDSQRLRALLRVVRGNNGCKNTSLGGAFKDNYKRLCAKSVNKSRIELSTFVSHVLSVTYDNGSGELKMYGLHQCWALTVANLY